MIRGMSVGPNIQKKENSDETELDAINLLQKP